MLDGTTNTAPNWTNTDFSGDCSEAFFLSFGDEDSDGDIVTVFYDDDIEDKHVHGVAIDDGTSILYRDRDQLTRLGAHLEGKPVTSFIDDLAYAAEQ